MVSFLIKLAKAKPSTTRRGSLSSLNPEPVSAASGRADRSNQKHVSYEEAMHGDFAPDEMKPQGGVGLVHCRVGDEHVVLNP